MWAMVKRGWMAFRHWRRGRPFWAGAMLFVAGVIILLPPYGTFRFRDMVITVNTLGGISALVVGCLLLLCGGTVWTRPRSRLVAGVAAMVLSLLALVTANLGGFFLGTLLGLLGGALCAAWSDSPRQAGRHRLSARLIGRRIGAAQQRGAAAAR